MYSNDVGVTLINRPLHHFFLENSEGLFVVKLILKVLKIKLI